MCDRKYKFSLGFRCILGPGECYMFISPQRLHSLLTDIGEREAWSCKVVCQFLAADFHGASSVG